MVQRKLLIVLQPKKNSVYKSIVLEIVVPTDFAIAMENTPIVSAHVELLPEVIKTPYGDISSIQGLQNKFSLHKP